MAGAPRRWLKAALVVSLVVNLLFVGLLAGLALRGGPGAGGPGFVGYARALPDDQRRELLRAARGRESEWRAEREALAAAGADLRAALRSQPFDAEAAAAALAGQRAAHTALAERAGTLLLERLERMTPEERAAFADRIERRGRHGPARAGP